MRRNSLFESSRTAYPCTLKPQNQKDNTKDPVSADKVFFIMIFSVICFGIAVDAAVDAFLFIGEAENVRELLLG